MKENEILEYRKQAYNQLVIDINNEFNALIEDPTKFKLSLEIINNKILLEQDEQLKSKEREAAYRIIRADLIKEAHDEQIKEARNYVPIPLSSYKDAEQERRTRPAGEDAEQRRAGKASAKPKEASSSPKPRQSDESKNIAAIAKAMGMTDEAAREWLEAQKTTRQTNNNPTNHDDDKGETNETNNPF